MSAPTEPVFPFGDDEASGEFRCAMADLKAAVQKASDGFDSHERPPSWCIKSESCDSPSTEIEIACLAVVQAKEIYDEAVVSAHRCSLYPWQTEELPELPGLKAAVVKAEKLYVDAAHSIKTLHANTEAWEKEYAEKAARAQEARVKEAEAYALYAEARKQREQAEKVSGKAHGHLEAMDAAAKIIASLPD